MRARIYRTEKEALEAIDLRDKDLGLPRCSQSENEEHRCKPGLVYLDCPFITITSSAPIALRDGRVAVPVDRMQIASASRVERSSRASADASVIVADPAAADAESDDLAELTSDDIVLPAGLGVTPSPRRDSR